MKLPTERELNIMWTVATSSSIETEEKPHIIFAKLLYANLTKENPRVSLGN